MRWRGSTNEVIGGAEGGFPCGSCLGRERGRGGGEPVGRERASLRGSWWPILGD